MYKLLLRGKKYIFKEILEAIKNYISINRKGQFYDINGGIVDGGSQEAHIPLRGNEEVIKNLIKKIWN